MLVYQRVSNMNFGCQVLSSAPWCFFMCVCVQRKKCFYIQSIWIYPSEIQRVGYCRLVLFPSLAWWRWNTGVHIHIHKYIYTVYIIKINKNHQWFFGWWFRPITSKSKKIKAAMDQNFVKNINRKHWTMDVHQPHKCYSYRRYWFIFCSLNQFRSHFLVGKMCYPKLYRKEKTCGLSEFWSLQGGAPVR